MAQHPPADTVVRYRSQLFLDAPERKSGCGAAGRDLGAIGLTRIEPHRIHGGKPADSSRQVDAGEQVLAAVPFEVDENRAASFPPHAAPISDRQRQRGQQRVVDAATIRPRHGCQQRLRLLHRQRDRQRLALAVGAALAIHRSVTRQCSSALPTGCALVIL